MLRFLRLDFTEGVFIMQATHTKGRMQATHSKGRMQATHPNGQLLAACGLDRFMAEVAAEPPVASEWKVLWWPRGRAAARRKEPRKANDSRHLRRMRGGVEKRKAASKFYCREKSAANRLSLATWGEPGTDHISRRRTRRFTNSTMARYARVAATTKSR